MTAMLLLCAVACGGNKQLGAQHDADRISRQEIMAGSFATAYDVVRNLHPNWLRLHNAESSRIVSQIWVYLDGTKYGGINQLNNIRAGTIASIERIDPRTATTRWGSGHSEGVIYVTTLTNGNSP
jgi:hypothetical protein